MVLDRSTKLRVRRVFRRRQKQVQTVTTSAGQRFDKNFFARLERLFGVQRFVIGWMFLILAITTVTILQTVGLSQFYTKLGPVAGGQYHEGMVGVFSNANPIYATGPVDTTVSRLLFAGLFKYDESNQLVGDLATGYDVDESGRTYTVHLKQGLRWHDNAPLTSADVVFTYKLIQNPDAKSPLLHSWEGIDVSAPNAHTVTFKLPNALTAFPHGLTNGIIPSHILRSVPARQMRADPFNTAKPVGAGPFAWDTLQLGSTTAGGDALTLISLKAFDTYAGGAPLLSGYVLHVYDDEAKLLGAYDRNTIQGIAGLTILPKQLAEDPRSHIYTFPTTAATMVFFKNTQPPFDDASVRRALVLAVDQPALIKNVDSQLKAVKEPFLKSQTPYYDKAYEQFSYDRKAAEALLDQAGWVKDKQGKRVKNSQELKVQITAEDAPDNQKTLRALKGYWDAIGVTTQAVLAPSSDFQSALETHSYSALLYGISIGADPDVFVYWDSSQSDPRSPNRLNFSEYKSAAADASLESGRTRQDVAVRALKYKAFLKAWKEDTPALGLYQPNSIYVTRGKIAGLNEHTLNTDADRYYSITEWSIKTGHILK